MCILEIIVMLVDDALCILRFCFDVFLKSEGFDFCVFLRDPRWFQKHKSHATRYKRANRHRVAGKSFFLELSVFDSNIPVTERTAHHHHLFSVSGAFISKAAQKHKESTSQRLVA